MRKSLLQWCFLTLLMVSVVSSTAWAQTFTGGVRGVVSDSGGIVPGVAVTLTNEGNGATREAVSNEQGAYNFSAVPPGTYTVKGALTGFKTFENKGVRVATQQFVTLDIKLDVGQLQETITVTGEAPLIDTSNASTGGVIDSRQLEALPSGGRSAFLFAVTIPTVIASGDAQFNRQQDQTNASLLSLGGGARRANNYLVDGVPVTDLRNRASANPTIEAIEGVNVQVHQYDAETGRTGGGTFNVATKSGGNDFHGAGFYQTRPKWGAANGFFSVLNGTPLPDVKFQLGGGGFGGPILKNRTFFWYAQEGYSSNTTRNGSVRFPTSRERGGDFSQSFDSAGNLVVIFDPLTGNADGTGRTPFPGNIIPATRINTVGKNLVNSYPSPQRDVSNGSANYGTDAQVADFAMMYTGKVDHRISDKVSLSGFYLYNKTDEPCSNFWTPGEHNAKDPNDYLLARRVQMVALNNTWLPSNNTVVTLRYGYTRFLDDDTLAVDYDPAQLGFSSNYLNNLQVKKYPIVNATDYDSQGAIDPTPRNWYSWSANGTASKLLGSHTVKLGFDYRTIGTKTQSFSGGAGELNFDRYYTSANPLANGVNGASPSGNAVASMLLGYPSGDAGNQSRVGVSSPFNAFVHYFGGYLQDDWRVGSKFTLNYGVRVERESGLMEENNGFTVAFDRTLNPGGALGAVVNPLSGQRTVGGLVYAGQNGANEYQGNPRSAKISPRVGMVYSFSPKMVVRSGYGVYWAPWNYQGVGSANYGQIGFSQNTFISQGQFRPTVTVDNPFPGGVSKPIGNTLGALTGVGSQVEFIDQNKRSPYVQQYSVDVSRELPGNIAVGFEYVGAAGRDLGLGGANDGFININQVPVKNLALGAALLEQVPNPYQGVAGVGGSLGSSATVQRRQLLRPFPQFNDIIMRQSTRGKSQYNAAVLKFEKRMSHGWAGRMNYTYSHLMDNQFGESNFFSRNSVGMLDANNLDQEYTVGILDVPHKITLSPIVELPFGEGKRWAKNGIGAAILGDWTISSIVSIESGFPISIATSNNTNIFTSVQRVNLTGVEQATTGSDYNRIAPPSGSGCVTGQECGIGIWLDRAAYATPAAFTLGTSPRTDGSVRTPARNNWDFVANKAVRLKGSMRGEIRLEVLNITNTVKVRGPISTLNSSTFGQIRSQSGFMRLTQLAFRLSF